MDILHACPEDLGLFGPGDMSATRNHHSL
jgi:hypothetical protein